MFLQLCHVSQATGFRAQVALWTIKPSKALIFSSSIQDHPALPFLLRRVGFSFIYLEKINHRHHSSQTSYAELYFQLQPWTGTILSGSVNLIWWISDLTPLSGTCLESWFLYVSEVLISSMEAGMTQTDQGTSVCDYGKVLKAKPTRLGHPLAVGTTLQSFSIAQQCIYIW